MFKVYLSLLFFYLKRIISKASNEVYYFKIHFYKVEIFIKIFLVKKDIVFKCLYFLCKKCTIVLFYNNVCHKLKRKNQTIEISVINFGCV